MYSVRCIDVRFLGRHVYKSLLLVMLIFFNPPLVVASEAPEAVMMQAYQAYHGNQDVVAALRLYRKLAEQGYAPAQTRLGYILDLGESDEEAVAWYQRASENGDAEGQLYLGQHLMLEGQHQIAKALEWWKKSAGQSYIPAILALGSYYADQGEVGTAISWWEKAVSLGSEIAARELVGVYRDGAPGVTPDMEQASKWESLRQEILTSGIDTNK